MALTILLRTLLMLLVSFHFILLFFILPFYLYFRWDNCYLTTLENRLRDRLGMKRILFSKHYIFKPYVRFKRKFK